MAFYLGKEADSQGRTIEEIWEWDHEDLEDTHDYIQWLFPLQERSAFNPDAPVLTPEAIHALEKALNCVTACFFPWT